MADASALWGLLRDTADPKAAAAIETAVESDSDRDLNRINALAFAAKRGLDEEATIGAFVHASRLGLFEMAWNLLCPSCRGVIESAAALRNFNRPDYFCAFCAMKCEATLDEIVEATFTVNPKVRRIAAHDPESLPNEEYLRQIFWTSAINLPNDFAAALNSLLLDATELEPGERATMSLALPAGEVILFEPVTHSSLFLKLDGEPTSERRNLPIVFSDMHVHQGSLTLQPGPLRIVFENKSGRRALPALWPHSEELNELGEARRPFLTAARLLSNQTFRDLYRSGAFDPEQRFKITSLTVLFTDLKGSTALYDRVGDLAAFDLVRSHFGELLAVVSAEGGAVVKTIGDAVMATFPTPDRALKAAMRMREAMRRINAGRGAEDLALNIGLHEGPCLAVMLDDRQDYFGLSVNVASRVQELADPTAVLVTKPIVENPAVARLLRESNYRTTSRQLALRGVSEEFVIYEVKEREAAAAAA